MTKTLNIFGSTGSIGESTLKVVETFPDAFRVRLLAARSSREKLLDQAKKVQPDWVAIHSEEDARWLMEQLHDQPTQVACGEASLVQLAHECKADLTVSAIVGAAGLKPTLASIEAGSDIALANKESMVVAGKFVNAAAEKHGVQILPVDSEHNALHQCLRGEKKEEVKRLILTASGGPFRTYEGDFSQITPEQALKHPTWVMGPKITIDSATLMNKGLEVIEAHYLFHFAPTEIDVVVHPQSIIHSLIETVDGSYLCQMGKNDMVHPIQYALSYPQRWKVPFNGFDVTQGLNLVFEKADKHRFPCLGLAYEALFMGGFAPAALNAANEIAVDAFLNHQIAFTDIPKIISRALERYSHRKVNNVEELLEADREVRQAALNWTGTKSKA